MTKVVLLERVENLGQMGDVVTVRPGFARNFLLPQKKALRASEQNIAYFEGQKKHLQAENDKQKANAEKLAKKIEGLKVPLIRQASEGGQLFGSVTARDIATEASKASGAAIERQMVILTQNFKSIGLFPVELSLHPEVKVSITINIARSNEEAEIQAKTGKALVADKGDDEDDVQVTEIPEDLLDESAKEIRKGKKAEEAEEAEEAAEAEKKSAARKAKKAKKAAEAEPEEGEAEEEGDNE